MKKGFTLIELLAVIVILAIIALIATPIILNIIDDSIEQAKKRSAENYLEAVELEIARKNFKSEFNPSEILVWSDGSAEFDGQKIEVDVDGEMPSEGYILYEDGKIIVALNLKYGDKYLTLANGKIKLTDTMIGDFDGDRIIENFDTAQLIDKITKEEYDEMLDVNLDEKLDDTDSDLLFKYESYKAYVDLINGR